MASAERNERGAGGVELMAGGHAGRSAARARATHASDGRQSSTQVQWTDWHASAIGPTGTRVRTAT